MININCVKERKHTTDYGERLNCNALLFGFDEPVNGTMYTICHKCGQKWRINIVDSEIEYTKLPKNTRFKFEDKLKVEE